MQDLQDIDLILDNTQMQSRKPSVILDVTVHSDLLILMAFSECLETLGAVEHHNLVEHRLVCGLVDGVRVEVSVSDEL